MPFESIATQLTLKILTCHLGLHEFDVRPIEKKATTKLPSQGINRRFPSVKNCKRCINFVMGEKDDRTNQFRNSLFSEIYFDHHEKVRDG